MRFWRYVAPALIWALIMEITAILLGFDVTDWRVLVLAIVLFADDFAKGLAAWCWRHT